MEFDAKDGKIIVTYNFSKPRPGYEIIAKRLQVNFRDPDNEVGEVRDAQSKVIGLRLRDSKNQLVDFPLVENPRFPNEFSNKALPDGQMLNGTAAGTLTLSYDRFYYAYNCRGAGNHPLAKAFDLKSDSMSKILDIKNNRTSAVNIYACGDAGTPKDQWIIVAAQKSGQQAAQAVLDDIEKAKSTGINWQENRNSPIHRQTSLLQQAISVTEELISRI